MLLAVFPVRAEGADTQTQEAATLPEGGDTLVQTAGETAVPAGILPEAAVPEAQVQLMQVETNGVLETVTQTRFVENGLGISFWYESEYLVVYDSVGETEDMATIFVNPVGEDSMLPIYMEITSAQALGMTPEQFLEEMPVIYSLSDVGPVTEVVMDTGEDFSCRTGLKDDLYYEFYTITGSKVPLCIIVQFPLEAIEGYGARLDRLIWSIAFVK